MAVMKRDFEAKYQVERDGDIEVAHLAAGSELRTIKVWERFVLVKDDAGHFHNVPIDAVELGAG